MDMDYIDMAGTGAAADTQMPLPDDSMLDDETRQYLAEGYIMGRDCFGADSKQYADTLMEYVSDEYSDYLYYQTLARRAPTNSARRLFRAISEDEQRHAKRFAAAYFLITGKRYFPTRTTLEPVQVPSSYIQALRQRYLAESRDAMKYRTFAQNSRDRCLQIMALQTADDEKRHAQEIMQLIQSL